MTTPKPETLPYPPPYMDLSTLAAHLCMGESTIEDHVRRGMFPAPIMQGGKRLWSWKTVQRHLEPRGKETALSPGHQPGEIADAVRKEVSRAKSNA